MADADSEALLLDGIVGKYGEGSDFDDLGNADEDALLEDDEPDFGGIKHSSAYHNESEELDHEPEELDSEDVLDLEPQDEDLEDDLDGSDGFILEKNCTVNTSAVTVSSTTQPELEISLQSQHDLEERERDTDKFKNERQGPASKSYNIPDSLDEVSVPPLLRNNRSGQRPGQFRGRGRGNCGNQRNNQMQRNRPDNKTVLINPHFKGQVKINNHARLAWDARTRITQRNQVGKVMPFTQNNRKNQAMVPVQPWVNSPNVPAPQYQPPTPIYQPPMQQAPQVSTWNQYQPNSYNQVPQPMGMNNHQHVFMQPLPFPNQPPQQFNQPPPQFNPPPVFQNQNLAGHPQAPVFGNQQFMAPPPAQQFHQPMEPRYHQGYNQNHQPQFGQPDNQFMPPPPNPQYGQPANNRFVVTNPPSNQFRNQRFVRSKPNFNQKISPKRKVEGNADLRKKKRTVASGNLHEVRTVETPDTTVKEDKPALDDEDEETRAYRAKIEEQKKRREQMLALKEERRKIAALQRKSDNASVAATPSNLVTLPQVPEQQQPKPRPVSVQQRNLQVIHTNQPVRTMSAPLRSHSSTSNAAGQQISNIKVINTDNDETSYDKQHLASFLSNRKILAKDQNLVDTSIVVVSNLSAGTTDVKLRRMCLGIGDIKKLQMSPKERQATIQFNSVASAHAFFKKYQRTMLDLSMIQVTLKPLP